MPPCSVLQPRHPAREPFGKLADIIVLQNNFLKVPDEELDDNKVLLTLTGGNVVYDAGIMEP